GGDAAGLPAGQQFRMDAGAAIAGLDLLVDGLDLDQQGIAALLLVAQRALSPGVVAGDRDLQHVTQHGHGPLIAARLDEAELHSASLAKKAVAFFKMSRS